MPRKNASLLVSLLILSILSLPLQAASEVKLVDRDQITRFNHVVAARYMGFDGESTVVIVFSTMDPKDALPLFDPWGESMFEKWIADTGAHVASISFTEGRSSVYRIDVITDTVQFVQGLGGEGAFRKFNLEVQKVEGEIHREMQSGLLSGIFEAAVETITLPEPISGPAVLENPAVQAMLSFESALRARDFERVRGLLLQESNGDALINQVEGLNADEHEEVLVGFFGAPDSFRRILLASKVYVHGDRTVVVFDADAIGQSEPVNQILIRIDGAWKLE